jgi:hypothetical protein
MRFACGKALNETGGLIVFSIRIYILIFYTSSERKSEKPRHLHLSPGGMFSPPPDFERSVFPPSERKSSVLPLINRPLWEQGGAIKTGFAAYGNSPAFIKQQSY